MKRNTEIFIFVAFFKAHILQFFRKKLKKEQNSKKQARKHERQVDLKRGRQKFGLSLVSNL